MSRPAAAAFRVGNLGALTVAGTIPVTSAQVVVDDLGDVVDVGAVLDISAIATGNVRRDKDLRRPSLLDLDRHPQATFASTQVRPHEAGWTVEGRLTVKGRTQELTLNVTARQEVDGTPHLRATGRLDRCDYGISAPRLMIGTRVDLDVQVTLRR